MTQREFAKLLNISQAAVSMALNDSPEISPEKRRHIRELAEKLGYRPNLAGQLLRKGRSNLLGVILPPLSYGFYAELLEELFTHARAHGYVLMLENCASEEDMVRIGKTMRQYNVAGILAGCGSAPAREFLPPEVPTVLIAGETFYDDGNPRVMWVQPDLYGSGRILGGYLLEKGKKNIVFVGLAREEEPRYQGLREVVEAAGHRLETIFCRDNTRQAGYELAAEVLARFPGCDAVAAHNDDMAIGFLSRFFRERIAVPERIAVAGFDNISSGAFAPPPLTSIGPGLDVFAETAITGVLDMLAGKPVKKSIWIKCGLAVRESA
ncbi:MAG: LacI family DNA-binding transcriptional regulator [Lentisphaeria bacterium]|nr:LacI family DNA-binding transcriptional regulator [Lentisphaeria bacterium]